MPLISVQTQSANYPVLIGRGLIGEVAQQVSEAAGRTSRVCIVTSPEIDALWGDRVRKSFPAATGDVHTLYVPAGERHKRLSTVERLSEELAGLRADRDTLLVALGGGVIGDITGFLAAVYMRGIRYVGVPTTLLAQVDSSVGGKSGVNLAAGKNLVGSFHHPVAVIADVDTLATLPPRELRAGLLESIKAAVLCDPTLFAFMEAHCEALIAGDAALLQHVVERSVQIKADVVAADEREGGLRMTLNLGHTLGHAIEAATHYSVLLHGEAVGWGMIAAVRLAQAREAILLGDAERIVSLIRHSAELPTFQANAEALVALTAGDKKNRSGARTFILPIAIGSVSIVRDVTEQELRTATEAMLREMHVAAAALT